MKLLRVSIISLLIASSAGWVFGQNINRALNQANSLQRGGLYLDALNLYLDLYQKGQRAFPVLNGITKCMEELKQYDELLSFYDELLRQFPERFNYQVEKGRIYFLQGNRGAADSVWQSVYMARPGQSDRYRMVGSVMVQLRLYDEAIEIYKLALEKTTGSQYLNRDIAMLYKAQLDYGSAADYFIRYYNAVPKQFAFVRQQIIAMSGEKSAIGDILNALQEHLAESDQDKLLLRIQAELYIRDQKFDRAYDIYHRIKDAQDVSRPLLDFADKAQKNHAFEYAIRAYHDLLKTIQPQQQPMLKIDLAQCYFAHAKWLHLQKKTEMANAQSGEAISVLNDLLRSTPDSKIKWRAMEEKADIYWSYYANSDSAIILYKYLLQRPEWAARNDIIAMKLGDIYFAKGKLMEARQQYKSVLTKNYRILAGYRLAEIQYFEGRFSPAENAFAKLSHSVNAGDTLMNNILSRLSFLHEFKKDSLELISFMKAEYLLRQNNKLQAAELFGSLAQQKSKLAKISGERAAKLYLSLKYFEEAISLLQELIERFPLEQDMDFAYFLLAEAYKATDNYDEALKAYRRVMVDYPGSFYTERAREGARQVNLFLKETP